MKQYKPTPTIEIYRQITDYVIAQLDKGEIIWQKPWNILGFPKNIVTGHHYKGWNIFFLNFITSMFKYRTPYFITYRQALDMGGTIRRGQKGYPVIWWATIEKKNEQVNEEKEEESQVVYRIPKTHTVFNIDQTFGIGFPKVEELFSKNFSEIDCCEHLINNMIDAPKILHGGDEAYYHMTRDIINLPAKQRFHLADHYYKTLFHELIHCTGHPKRLNREELIKSDGFSVEKYSKEELTAELGAAFLCGHCGISNTTIENSSAYIQGWLRALRNDRRLILKASSQAQAAVEYIYTPSGTLQRERVDEESILIEDHALQVSH